MDEVIECGAFRLLVTHTSRLYSVIVVPEDLTANYGIALGNGLTRESAIEDARRVTMALLARLTEARS